MHRRFPHLPPASLRALYSLVASAVSLHWRTFFFTWSVFNAAAALSSACGGLRVCVCVCAHIYSSFLFLVPFAYAPPIFPPSALLRLALPQPDPFCCRPPPSLPHRLPLLSLSPYSSPSHPPTHTHCWSHPSRFHWPITRTPSAHATEDAVCVCARLILYHSLSPLALCIGLCAFLVEYASLRSPLSAHPLPPRPSSARECTPVFRRHRSVPNIPVLSCPSFVFVLLTSLVRWLSRRPPFPPSPSLLSSLSRFFVCGLPAPRFGGHV